MISFPENEEGRMQSPCSLCVRVSAMGLYSASGLTAEAFWTWFYKSILVCLFTWQRWNFVLKWREEIRDSRAF